jgi:hypothetical protein
MDITKGFKSIEYFLNKEKEILDVSVILLPTKDMCNVPFVNCFYGVATLNGEKYDHPSLKNCVNAQVMAEEIAEDEINKLKIKHKNQIKIKESVTKNEIKRRKNKKQT